MFWFDLIKRPEQSNKLTKSFKIISLEKMALYEDFQHCDFLQECESELSEAYWL